MYGGNIHALCQAGDSGREAFLLDEMDSLQSKRLQRALRSVGEDQPIWTQFYGQYKWHIVLCPVWFLFQLAALCYIDHPHKWGITPLEKCWWDQGTIIFWEQ